MRLRQSSGGGVGSYMVSPSMSIRLICLCPLLGQLRAKWPISPQLKQALLVERGWSVFVARPWKFWYLPLPLPWFPHRRQLALDRLRSIATGWLFILGGALEVLYCGACCPV